MSFNNKDLVDLRGRFYDMGYEGALAHIPTKPVDEEWLWRRAQHLASRRLIATEVGDRGRERAVLTAKGAYLEGWMVCQHAQATIPHLRLMSQVWHVGYRSASDCHFLDTLLRAEDEQACCRLLVDIRYRPLAPFQPQWSRKQLRIRYRHQYRHLHALGNKHYNDALQPIELVDEEAGINCLVSLLQVGWDVILLCACEDAAFCHRLLVLDCLQQRVQDDTRIRIHQGSGRKEH